MPIEVKPEKHLINALVKTRDHHPNFTLLLGAGASVESGVKTGNVLVKEWRKEYCEIHGCDEDDTEFLEKQRWYKQPEEYSVLFESLFDQPSLRREFVESLLKDANPSWGYLYLVNLIRNRVFNTVFTTNFDDLLNEVCYLFSTDIRPMVCAHDSSISSIRMFSKRPKIIKLHGDFLYDSIKNTVRELENLEDNIREKFKQCAGEFGLIVLGYGGNDRSVMDTLDALLRNERCFPHGIYWCVRDRNSIPGRVTDLARFAKFHIVEISGFDDFFASLHAKLELGLPIDDPYSTIRERFASLVSSLPVPKPWVREQGQLHKDVQLFCNKLISKNSDEFVSNEMRCLILYNKGEFVDALHAVLPSLQKTGGIQRWMDVFELAIQCCLKSRDPSTFDVVVSMLDNCKLESFLIDWFLVNRSVGIIEAGCYAEAKLLFEWTLKNGADDGVKFVNLVLIKRLQKKRLSRKESARLEEFASGADLSFRFCSLILLKRYREALDQLEDRVAEDSHEGIELLEDLRGWPIVQLLPKEHVERLKELQARRAGKVSAARTLLT